jgi:methanogenic corrinoid protein MtbC1
MSKIEELAIAIENGKLNDVPAIVEAALAEGNDPLDILNKGMIDAMSIVGEKFKNNEIFVPEMLISARAMKSGVEVLKPKLAETSGATIGKCIIGTVAGDLHDIGKNLVGMMLESAGIEVIDLGVDVSAQKFVDAVKNTPDCDILALSALLTTTLENLKNTIAAVKDAGFNQVKIMVGGAPVTEAFAHEVGADGFATDAAAASNVAKKLLGH